MSFGVSYSFATQYYCDLNCSTNIVLFSQLVLWHVASALSRPRRNEYQPIHFYCSFVVSTELCTRNTETKTLLLSFLGVEPEEPHSDLCEASMSGTSDTMSSQTSPLLPERQRGRSMNLLRTSAAALAALAVIVLVASYNVHQVIITRRTQPETHAEQDIGSSLARRGFCGSGVGFRVSYLPN